MLAGTVRAVSMCVKRAGLSSGTPTRASALLAPIREKQD
jgi:hypothetical protein